MRGTQKHLRGVDVENVKPENKTIRLRDERGLDLPLSGGLVGPHEDKMIELRIARESIKRKVLERSKEWRTDKKPGFDGRSN